MVSALALLITVLYLRSFLISFNMRSVVWAAQLLYNKVGRECHLTLRSHIGSHIVSDHLHSLILFYLFNTFLNLFEYIFSRVSMDLIKLVPLL